jgi:hypothetical protein
MNTNLTVPFACEISRLDREARSREQTLLAWFHNAFTEAEWTGSDYRFTIAADRESLRDLGEFLALERVCCPFLTFRLEVDRAETAVLSISGREGVQAFIAATFLPV